MNSGPKVRLKKGAPTEIFWPVTASSASGIQRSDQHRGAGCGEEEVVEHEGAFARHWSEKPPCP